MQNRHPVDDSDDDDNDDNEGIYFLVGRVVYSGIIIYYSVW